MEVLGEGDTLMYEIPLSAEEKKDPKNKKAFHARANFEGNYYIFIKHVKIYRTKTH